MMMRIMVKVSILIPCRNGEKTLPETLDSLLKQTIQTEIVVADDASVDATPQIIKQFEVQSVRHPTREPRNYARVPTLINMALEIAPPADYYMISGDDNIYPPDYLEKLIKFMQRDGVDLASGYNKSFSSTKTPTGSGRIMSASSFKKLMPLPENVTWDTWMLFKMLQTGAKYRAYPVKKKHLKERRVAYSHGHAAHILGTPLVFTLFRVAKRIVRKKRPLQALSIFIGQLEYMLRRIPKMKIAPFVYQIRKYRIKRKILKTMKVIND